MGRICFHSANSFEFIDAELSQKLFIEETSDGRFNYASMFQGPRRWDPEGSCSWVPNKNKIVFLLMIAATIVGKLNLRRSQVCRTRNLHRRKTFSSFPSPCLPRKKHFREIPRTFFAFIFKFLRRRKSAQTYDTRHNHSDLCDHSFLLIAAFDGTSNSDIKFLATKFLRHLRILMMAQ